jgi:hypothetical protein
MAEDAVNDQIADAVAQINRTIGEASESQARAMADQVMAHAVALAMQNAVAQQQQAYILRNAVTTAAARAILESSPEDALRFAREVLSGDDVAQTLERLGELVGGARARKPKKGD